MMAICDPHVIQKRRDDEMFRRGVDTMGGRAYPNWIIDPHRVPVEERIEYNVDGTYLEMEGES
jgi:hypothetical protein